MKKKNIKTQKPTLSKADRIAYKILLTVSMFLPFVICLSVLLLKRRLALLNAEALAMSYSNLTFLLCIIPLFAALFMPYSLLLKAYSLQKPLFGKKDKAHSDQNSPLSGRKDSGYYKTAATVFLSVFICCLSVPCALFPRTELTDSSINVYNFFNQAEKSVSLKDVQSVNVYIEFEPQYPSGKNNLIYKINTADSSYSFKLSDFRSVYTLRDVDKALSEQNIPKKVNLPDTQTLKSSLELYDFEAEVIRSIAEE